MPQAGCDLSAVFDHKQAKVAVALLEHKVVCLSDLFRRGTKRESGICEARFGECGVCAVCVAVLFGLGGLEVGGDGGAPGRVVGWHFGLVNKLLGVGLFIYYSVTGATSIGSGASEGV